MKRSFLKNSVLVLLLTATLSACDKVNINSAFLDLANQKIELANVLNNLNAVSQVNNTNVGLSRIIQRDNNDFVIVYSSEDHGDKHIYVTVSKNAKNWSSPLKISNSQLTDTNPSIIEDKNGLLRVFYTSNQNNDWQIFQITSKDGKNWSKSEIVNLDYQGVHSPYITQNNTGDLVLTYQTVGSGIFTAFSKDGNTWEAHMISETGSDPSIQFFNNKYLSVYESKKGIYYRESPDLINWSVEKKINNNSKYPSLSVYQNKLTLSYATKDDNSWNIYSQKLIDNKWSELKKITSNNFNNTRPAVFSNNKMSIMSWTVENNNTLDNNSTLYVGIDLK